MKIVSSVSEDMLKNAQRARVSPLDINQSAAFWVFEPDKLNATDRLSVHEYVTRTLLTMGFNRSQIETILPQLDTKDKAAALDTAIAILTADPLLAANDDIDAVTEEEQKEAIHRQQESHLSSAPIPVEQVMKKYPEWHQRLVKEEEEKGDKIECIICMENKAQPEFWKSPCEHYDFVCLECVAAYFKQNIVDGKVEIFCLYPGCPEFIDEAQILKVIQHDTHLIQKYKRFHTSLRISKNPNIRWCPKPACDGYIELDESQLNADKRPFACNLCKTQICAECGEIWHEHQTCEQAQHNRIKLCAACNAGVVKPGNGCNHIKCRQCGYEFWLGMYWHVLAWNSLPTKRPSVPRSKPE